MYTCIDTNILATIFTLLKKTQKNKKKKNTYIYIYMHACIHIYIYIHEYIHTYIHIGNKQTDIIMQEECGHNYCSNNLTGHFDWSF